MIPFVPRAISTVRRSTPTVKNYRSSLSNALDKAVKLGEKERRMSARLNNETYETVQRLMDDPSYMRRAQEDKKYFTQEEAHEVIEFLIRRCYELGATKNY